MRADYFFQNVQNSERLFLTYHRNPDNYTQIKTQVAGEAAQQAWQRGQRGRWVFMASIIFICTISSAFAWFMELGGSFTAIWIICFAFVSAISLVSFFSYQTRYKELQANVQFFENFENIASTASTVEEFRALWANQKPA